MAKPTVCFVYLRNPKTFVATNQIYFGSMHACGKYVQQAISKGQDPNRLVIVPMQLTSVCDEEANYAI